MTLADFAEPLMVLDLDGRLSQANQAAEWLAERLGTPLVNGSSIEPFLSGAPVANGGGSPAWVPGSRGVEAFATAAKWPPVEQAFELRSTLRHDAEGRSTDWLVQLVDITPLVAALRERHEAVAHRDRLLKLLSHDMRTPLAAILATLKHPDLAGAPAHLRDLIESAAHRALSMVDSNVRLIRAQCSDYRFVELEFCHVVEEAIDACWSLAKDAGIRIVLEPTTVGSPILADRGYLTEAFNELFAYLVDRGVSSPILSCDLSASFLREKSATTVRIRGAGRGELDLGGEGGGLNLFKTVVTRHGGVVEGGNGTDIDHVVAVTIPSAEVTSRPS